MPSFLFISGYFAKHLDKPHYLENVAKKLIAPYAIFYAFFSIYYFVTGKSDAIQMDPFNSDLLCGSYLHYFVSMSSLS